MASLDQGAVLASLKNAYSAADDAYVAALMKGASADQLALLDGARQHTLLSYTTAVSESLVTDNPFTQQLKTQLDDATKQVNAALQNFKDIAQLLGFVDSLAKLAGSLASAFA